MHIKFLATGLDIKVPATENTKFNELVKKLFEMRKVEFEKNKTKNSYEISLSNKNLEWDSKLTVKELGLKNNGIVYVKGPAGSIIPKTERKADRFKTSIVEEKGEKNIPENFPDILGDMAVFSEECLSEILENNESEDDNFIDYKFALRNKFKDKHIFLFGLIGKYLVELGTNVRIDISNDKKFDRLEKMKGLMTLRYLSNGFITKTKSTVSLSPKSINDMNNDKIRKDINNKFKNNLMQEYPKLKNDNFVVTSVPNNEVLKFLLVQVKEGNVELEQTKIQKCCSKTGFFINEDANFEDDIPLMETIILNKSFLLPQFDSNDDSKFGYNEERGKEKYYPPTGWWRFGVLAYDNYGNDNSWLGYDGKSWCVAYVGLRKAEIEQKVKEFENDEDLRHPGKKVGLGVAVCQNPEDMEEDCEEIEVGNEVYKIGFMLRIKPEAIRIPKSGKGKYWVVNGTKEDLRPYSILSKRIRW